MTKKCYFLPESNFDKIPPKCGFYFCTCNQTTVVFHYICILTSDELIINFEDETYHCNANYIPLLNNWFNEGMDI